LLRLDILYSFVVSSDAEHDEVPTIFKIMHKPIKRKDGIPLGTQGASPYFPKKVMGKMLKSP